jgi:hypothetical protein
MNRFRRLRGILGLSLAWGIAWIPLGMLVSVAESLAYGRPIDVGALFADAPKAAPIGAVCGFAFSLVLAGLERRRTFASLSGARLFIWGVAGALIIPVLAVMSDPFGFSVRSAGTGMAVFAILGGVSAAATLAIARRAPPELPAAPPHDSLPLEP